MTKNQTSTQICLRGVQKFFGPLHVLRDLDLDIRRGEFVTLMGPSGCGKTTLLRCLNALELISNGELLVNGVSLSPSHLYKQDLNAFRARLGMVFQQFNLFPHLSVLENITLGPVKVKKTDRAQAELEGLQLLDRVGLKDKASKYPSQLSGGQKQRVAIVRSMAMNPDILLLDEPTSALDPLMAREVLAVIQDVAREGMTMVMVTHAWRFARRSANRIILMNQGEIIEDGSPEDVESRSTHSFTRQFFQELMLD